MRLLILGGTRFVGRHLVEAARAGGHDVTILHRGRSGRSLWPDVHEILADRDGDLPDALGDATWDAVVDTSGYVPRVVRASLDALRDRADRYGFVSTISVYASFERPRQDETAPLTELRDPTTEEVTGDTYGGLKVLCEHEVRSVYGDDALIVRPGYVVGPHDYTDRFTYWVERIARGGRVASPPPPEAPAQFIDARDLGAWIVSAVENEPRGTFNAVGPDEPLTFEGWFERTRDAIGSDAEFVWVPEERIRALGLEDKMPLWSSQQDPDARFVMDVDASRALAAGLSYRPLEATVVDTLRWFRSERDGDLTAGLTPAEEAMLLRDREVR
jgi:2'-hydroxyisoflavone reductase